MRAIEREGSELVFHPENFPRITMEKLKAGKFYSSQIRELMKGAIFDEVLNKAELFAWQSLKSVITNFLESGIQEGNFFGSGMQEKIWRATEKFPLTWGTNARQNTFLRSYFDYFPKKLWRFEWRVDNCLMEVHYQGQWDYCYYLKRDVVAVVHRRKSLKRTFHLWIPFLCIFHFTIWAHSTIWVHCE